SEFVFGFISLGIGQELMRIGLLKPWSENIPFLLGIGIVGLFFIRGGFVYYREISSLVHKAV
ncbi:hypothetical protein RFF84_08085, partial [Streptococcus ruminantium]